jgi:hypothetical protein
MRYRSIYSVLVSKMKLITKEGLVRQLREKGFKIIPQRRAIHEALVENKMLCPGAHLIFEEVGKMIKSLSLSMVYATMGKFSQNGLVKSPEFDRMDNRYEGNLGAEIVPVSIRRGPMQKGVCPHRATPFRKKGEWY